MLYRVLGLVCVAVALAMFANGSAVGAGDKAKDTVKDTASKGDKNTHEGKLVSVKDHEIVMQGKTGGKEHTHMVAKDAKITCDGKNCKLSDLKPGVMIRVTVTAGNEATRIEASTKDSTKSKQ